MERRSMSMVDLKFLANQLAHEQPSIVPGAASSNTVSDPLAQYGCGPIKFSGTDSTFYERRLIFDKVIDPSAATLRDQFEVFALSLRDVLAQRWVLTTRTHAQQNPKRVYYLSMEYLLG
ncbi:MAG: hypothetical protein WA446_11190 [Steroidobacteraceae bacterium]